MNVVDLHPEELIDKLAARELTQPERERLNAHLQQCSACRFELSVRAELEAEMSVLQVRPQLTPPGASEGTRPIGAAGRRVGSLRPRSRRRLALVMLAAALVLCAGGAMAAVLSGAVQPHWLPWTSRANTVGLTPSATWANIAPKTKRVAPKKVVSSEAEAIPSAQESVPSVSVERRVAPASQIASATVQTKPASKTPTGAQRHTAGATSLGLAGGVATPAAANADAEVSPHVEGALPRVDPAAALFAEANRARRDGNADRAMTMYRSLQTRFPNSPESTLSRALVAQLQLDRGSPDAALAGFDRYLSADATALGAEALVGRARALEQLGRSAQAAAAWREVQSRFPGSVHARLAATRLAALGMR